MVNTVERPAAMQTDRLFEDGELRVRFRCEEVAYLGFNVRLGLKPGYGVEWDRRGVNQISGPEHELVFRLKGEEVAATLDGSPLPVVIHSRNRSGTLHFGSVGGRLRIRSIDFRT